MVIWPKKALPAPNLPLPEVPNSSLSAREKEPPKEKEPPPPPPPPKVAQPRVVVDYTPDLPDPLPPEELSDPIRLQLLCRCRNSCHLWFKSETLHNLRKDFKSMDENQRNLFHFQNCDYNKVDGRRTITYEIKGRRVCKSFYIRVLGINWGTIRTIMHKALAHNLSSRDRIYDPILNNQRGFNFKNSPKYKSQSFISLLDDFIEEMKPKHDCRYHSLVSPKKCTKGTSTNLLYKKFLDWLGFLQVTEKCSYHYFKMRLKRHRALKTAAKRQAGKKSANNTAMANNSVNESASEVLEGLDALAQATSVIAANQEVVTEEPSAEQEQEDPEVQVLQASEEGVVESVPAASEEDFLCKCRTGCQSKFDVRTLEQLRIDYRNLDPNQRSLFHFLNLRIYKVDSRASVEYRLKGVTVCKNFYLKTLGAAYGKIRTLVHKVVTHNLDTDTRFYDPILNDQRGQNLRRLRNPHSKSERFNQLLEQFINEWNPVHNRHHRTTVPNRRYIYGLTAGALYKKFLERLAAEGIEEKCSYAHFKKKLKRMNIRVMIKEH